MMTSVKMFASVGLCLFATILFVGCGGGEEASAPGSSSSETNGETSESESTESKNAKTESSDSTETPKSEASGSGIGSFGGTITLTGEIPTLQPLVKQGDESAKDASVCAVATVPNETIVVGDGNGLANVFVFLPKPPEGAPEMEPATDEIEFDQKGCQFIPHALVLQTSQKVKAVSSDAVAHNLHTYPIRNNAINQTINPNDKSGLMIEYPDPELTPVKVACDIHPWMSAWHLPLDHSYSAVTDAEGKFLIENLPSGTHEFRLWHEQAGWLERKLEVTVKAGEPVEKNLEYSIDKFVQE